MTVEQNRIPSFSAVGMVEELDSKRYFSALRIKELITSQYVDDMVRMGELPNYDCSAKVDQIRW